MSCGAQARGLANTHPSEPPDQASLHPCIPASRLDLNQKRTNDFRIHAALRRHTLATKIRGDRVLNRVQLETGSFTTKRSPEVGHTVRLGHLRSACPGVTDGFSGGVWRCPAMTAPARPGFGSPRPSLDRHRPGRSGPVGRRLIFNREKQGGLWRAQSVLSPLGWRGADRRMNPLRRSNLVLANLTPATLTVSPMKRVREAHEPVSEPLAHLPAPLC